MTNTINGTSGNDTLTGTAGDDDIFGGDGNDSIDGGNGWDVIYGGTGDDTIAGGTDGVYDDIYGGAGNDTIYAGDDDNNWIYGGGDNDAIYGGANRDTIWADSGDDVISSNAGDDTVFGGSGHDSIHAGDGDDVLTGEDGNDTLTGHSGADMFYGGLGADTVYGGDGADTIRGEEGNDQLFGGNDNDVFQMLNTAGTDTIDGGGGNDTVQFFSDTAVTITYNVSGHLDYTQAGGDTQGTLSSIETIQTSGGDDDLNFVGVSTSITVDAGIGNDTIVGGNGNDTLGGGDGNDSISGGAGSDRLEGGSGADQLDGGSGDDIFDGGSGNDTLSGGSGADIFYNGWGDDVVYGGADDDTIFDGDGNDTLFGGAGRDTFEMDEAGGTDTIFGGETGTDGDKMSFQSTLSTDGVVLNFTGAEAGTYALTSTTANGTFSQIEEFDLTEDADTVNASASGASLTVSGLGGDDSIIGGSSDDIIDAGAGADTIAGGGGNDQMSGGTGDDVFVLSEAGGDDVVTDFDTTDSDGNGFTNDQLDVSDLQNPDGSPVRVGDVTVLDDGSGNAKLVFPEGESVVLQGVTPGQLATNVDLNAIGIPCFTPGAMIATEQGERRIEDLRVGDRVFTRDHGMQAIRWIGRRMVPAAGPLAPIKIGTSVFGELSAPLLVSPQHRMLFTGVRAELLFGQSEVLVAAKHLVDGKAVTQEEGGTVVFLHLMFDQHEVIYANGVPSESFHPADVGVGAVDAAAREELFQIFPELRADLTTFGDTARMCLRSFEAQLLQM